MVCVVSPSWGCGEKCRLETSTEGSKHGGASREPVAVVSSHCPSLSMCAGNAAAVADSESVFLASIMMENHAMVLATAPSRVPPRFIAEKTFASSK